MATLPHNPLGNYGWSKTATPLRPMSRRPRLSPGHLPAPDGADALLDAATPFAPAMCSAPARHHGGLGRSPYAAAAGQERSVARAVPAPVLAVAGRAHAGRAHAGRPGAGAAAAAAGAGVHQPRERPFSALLYLACVPGTADGREGRAWGFLHAVWHLLRRAAQWLVNAIGNDLRYRICAITLADAHHAFKIAHSSGVAPHRRGSSPSRPGRPRPPVSPRSSTP